MCLCLVCVRAAGRSRRRVEGGRGWGVGGPDTEEEQLVRKELPARLPTGGSDNVSLSF